MLRYNVTGADISCESSLDSAPSMPEWMYGPMKFDLTNSPNSPLSIPFDPETYSQLAYNQEQYSSSGNISPFSGSNSYVGYTNSYNQISPSPNNFSQTVCSSESSGSQDQTSSHTVKHALLEIESALMGPDADEDGVANTTYATFSGNSQAGTSNQRPRSCSQEVRQDSFNIRSHQSPSFKQQTPSYSLHPEKRPRMTGAHSPSPENPQCNLKRLLTECARALDEGRNDFEELIEKARGLVSINGEPIQRLGAYLVEGLVARKEKSGNNIYRTLKCRRPESKELLTYMYTLYEICPYMKFGYMAANGAIAEAFRNESRVHIIDFQIAEGGQWTTLIEALAASPNGPPHMRITGIDDPVYKYARGGSLAAVGEKFAALSKQFNIPIEFIGLPVFAADVTRDMFDIRPGEALAVNFPLQLHHTPDESIDVNNPRDGIIRMIKSLSPKVVTLIEQDSNTNTTPFLTRFSEVMGFYSAMFESIDVTMARDSKDRINVEQQCLARDLVNVIACEGKDRVERHELLGKWKLRFTMAGFQPYPLSPLVNSVIRTLLGRYSEHYTPVEKDGAMLLGWKGRSLISASAWH